MKLNRMQDAHDAKAKACLRGSKLSTLAILIWQCWAVSKRKTLEMARKKKESFAAIFNSALSIYSRLLNVKHYVLRHYHPKLIL